MLAGLLRPLLLGAALAAAAAPFAAGPAAARDDCAGLNVVHVRPGDASAFTCKLGLNKSKVLELPSAARDILVSNPVIADAVIRTNRRIYITGIAVGQASIFVFDQDNKLMVNLSLDVERDISTLESTLNRLITGANITAELINDNVILSGSVRNAMDARRAGDLADMFANGGANSQAQQDREGGGGGGGTAGVVFNNDSESSKSSRIVNMLTIEGEDQVHLKVTVAEVQRDMVKQLGVDLDASVTGADFNLGAAFRNAASTAAGAVGFGIGTNDFLSGVLTALAQEGMLRTLAEPTLTAISGEAASFLAGGEFPVPTAYDEDTDTVTVTYKQFGVGLSFTPVVLSEGRISLHLKTEVSELSSRGAVSIGPISIPSLTVRRAESTLEIPSGGSLVMAGMLQDNVRQSIEGFPVLKDLPVLGTLFRSRDFQRSETELVIIVTPYLVRPTARTALARPDDGFAPPSDAAGAFLGRLNRMYGVRTETGTYHGRPGFIIE